MDVASVTIAEQTLNDVQQFPISYKIEYDVATLAHGMTGKYLVRAEIRNKDSLIYITDTSFNVLDATTNKLLGNVDFHVIGLGNQVN